MTAVVEDKAVGPGSALAAFGRPRLLGRLSVRTIVTPFLLVIAAVAVWKLAESRITDFDRLQVQSVLNREFMQARLGEHVRLSAFSTLLAGAVAIPAGIAMTRSGFRPFTWRTVSSGSSVRTVLAPTMIASFAARWV